MKTFIHNIFTLMTALIGLIGGLLWCLKSNWEYEPLILMLISIIEVFAYFLIPKEQSPDNANTMDQTITSSYNISNITGSSISTNNSTGSNIDIRINNMAEKDNTLEESSNAFSENRNFEMIQRKIKFPFCLSMMTKILILLKYLRIVVGGIQKLLLM